MKKITTLLLLLTVCSVMSQEARQLLRGKVMYRHSNVINENVINSTAQQATITNKNGEFEIFVKEGDQLVFTAVNYQLKVVKITKEILINNRLVVEVNEKVTELDEVVVGPENQEKFLELKNEEFKEIEYEIDRSSAVENVAVSDATKGMSNGINFVNIFKAMVKSNKKETEKKPPLKMSQVLRQVYDDEFFVADLGLPQDKINDFLFYCDQNVTTNTLLKKDNEFALIDFLVNQSRAYKKQLNSEN